MNCQTIQHQMLASERPEHPAPAVQRHLLSCPACHAVQRSLLQLQAALPRLPVPPSSGPEAALQAIFQATPASSATLPFARRLGQRPPRLGEWARRKLALASALAASLLVFTLGWWAWPHAQTRPVLQKSLVRYQTQRDQRWRAATTPRQRVEILADLADEMLGSLDSVEDHTRLAELAQVYARLVRTDLLEQANRLSAAECTVVLPAVADRLRRTESAASRLAAEHSGPRAESLRLIAQTARQGDLELRALLAQRS